jgi:hypothetical protein
MLTPLAHGTTLRVVPLGRALQRAHERVAAAVPTERRNFRAGHGVLRRRRAASVQKFLHWHWATGRLGHWATGALATGALARRSEPHLNPQIGATRIDSA